MRSRASAFLLLIVAAAISLSACSGEPSSTTSAVHILHQKRGEPTGLTPQQVGSPHIAWTTDHRKLVLVTYGSGSCPVVPVRATVHSVADVTFAMKVYSGACTADLSPTTVVFAPPKGISARTTVHVTLAGGDGESDASLGLTPEGTVTP